MSWYAEIRGEVETSLKAYDQVMEVIGLWTKPEAEGQVELEKDGQAGTLLIRFQECYRNLGRYVNHEIWKLAEKYPKQTQGEYSVYSIDGDTYFALFRVEGGKLYRREIAPTEEKVLPYPVRDSKGKEVMTIMLSKSEFRRMKRRKGRRSRKKGSDQKSRS